MRSVAAQLAACTLLHHSPPKISNALVARTRWKALLGRKTDEQAEMRGRPTAKIFQSFAFIMCPHEMDPLVKEIKSNLGESQSQALINSASSELQWGP